MRLSQSGDGGRFPRSFQSSASGPSPGGAPAGRAEEAPGDARPETVAGRVLVVDDEAAIRLVCKLNLETAGFDTIEADDGETALELARSERPDLILLDIMLPNADGFGVAQTLADAPETRETPILFITARSDPRDELRGYEAGGVGFVTKPFDPDVLGETVRAAIERVRRGEREAMRAEWRATLQ
jgi:DNA-binding response OmpR family regulator